MKEMDYQEVLNSQEIYGDELAMFAKKELQKEVSTKLQQTLITLRSSHLITLINLSPGGCPQGQGGDPRRGDCGVWLGLDAAHHRPGQPLPCRPRLALRSTQHRGPGGGGVKLIFIFIITFILDYRHQWSVTCGFAPVQVSGIYQGKIGYWEQDIDIPGQITQVHGHR